MNGSSIPYGSAMKLSGDFRHATPTGWCSACAEANAPACPEALAAPSADRSFVTDNVVGGCDGPIHGVERSERASDFCLLEPYYDRILVRRDPDKTEQGGLAIPETHRDAHRQHVGTVIAVGHGRLNADGTLRPLITRVGDRIVFGEFAGVKLPEDVGGENMWVMREDEVLGRKAR